MMWDGFNKRKFPRVSLRCELVLKNQPAGQILQVQTENLGAGGLCVILERPLERFSTLSIRLELDRALPWIECLGKVVWTVPSRAIATKKECFDTGIEFVNLEPALQDLIRSFVESRVEVS